ncbi:MAG TPA: right-handed parallel beta-helix repeat-containing protein [Nitrospiraceae bacterium]|nr:right-handed parallel beta-helix repeat-containing protein [Nitrospiraceae bacterium]
MRRSFSGTVAVMASVPLTLLCCLTEPTMSAPLRTFYVATTGDDTANGSVATPWRTLQRAAQNVVPGDLIIVRPGRYAGFVLGWDSPQNGTAANPITFQGEPGAVIEARNLRTADGINLEGASYIVIEGFAIANGGTITRAGIRSVINQHVVIRNNQVDQAGRWGILTGFSDNVTIENNITSRSQIEHGIYVSNSSVNAIVRNNQVWGNAANGIHMNGDLSQGGNGLILNALVEKNVIYDNGRQGGSGINGDGVQNSKILNNVLYNNHASGISLYRIDGADGARNNLVAHNTIIMAADGRWALNIQNGSTGNRAFNNILYNNHPFRGSIDISTDSLVGLISDYNVTMERFATDGETVLNLAEWRQNSGQDQHSLVAVPSALFVNAAGSDYHLTANSPARDAGVIRADVPADREGTTRPMGPTSDIGAYEFRSTTDTTPPLAPQGIRLLKVQ